MPGNHTEYASTFLFLYHILCVKEFLLSSSYVALLQVDTDDEKFWLIFPNNWKFFTNFPIIIKRIIITDQNYQKNCFIAFLKN